MYLSNTMGRSFCGWIFFETRVNFDHWTKIC